MSMGQVQIIRSLAQTLEWYEKELTWDSNPSELKHLVGRIGELFAATVTSGAMAINPIKKDLMSLIAKISA